MKIKNLHYKEEGVSVVEVIIAIVIIGIILISFFPFMLNSVNTSQNNLYRAEAIQLARSQTQNARQFISGSVCDESLIPSININSNVQIVNTTLDCPIAGENIATYIVEVSMKDETEVLYSMSSSIRVETAA